MRMPSSRSQVVSPQALDPEWKAIPLEKFSSAISPLGASSHHWVHDVRKDDLFLVFRPVRIACDTDKFETQLLMTISAGVEILESQDVRKLATMAGEFDHFLRQGRIDGAVEAPVHVVIKLPCVALRYPASPSMVRRIQMRFKTELDYQRAIEIFKEIKLPMRSAGSKESSAAFARPLKPATEGLVQIAPKPSSVHTYLAPAPTHFNVSSFSEPKPHPPVDSRFFTRPHTTDSEVRKAGDVWLSEGVRPGRAPPSVSFVQPSLSPKAANKFSWQFDSQQNVEHHMPTAVVPTQKAESAAYEISQNMSYNAIPAVGGMVPEIFGPPLSSSRGFETTEPIPASQYGLRQFRRGTSSYGAGVIAQLDDYIPFEKPLALLSDARPMSAPVHNAQYLSSPPLPPRRELPFPKARSVAKSCALTTELSLLPPSELLSYASKNNDDIQNAAPVAFTPDPKRTSRIPRISNMEGPVQIPRCSLLNSRTGQDPDNGILGGLAPRVEEPSPLAAKSRALARPATAPGLRSKATATGTRKRPSDLTDPKTLASKQIKRTVDRGTQTQTLSGRDHTAPLNLSLTNDRPGATPVDGGRPQSPPINFTDHVDAFVSTFKNRTLPQELWVMPSYSEATPEQRQTIINDFICDNLDSEEFLQLCEDTAEVWRRIGLEK